MVAKKRPPAYKGNWLRDRDIIGAWAFRVVATGLLGILLWNARTYTNQIDELAKEVPVLSNTVAALTAQIRVEQDQINKLWDRLFDSLAQAHKK